MAEQRLIEVNAFRESMKERYRKTEKLIKKGEKHLDRLAEGFMEVDELLSAAPTVNAVVLPCKVGDTVWIIKNIFSNEIHNTEILRHPLERKVTYISIMPYGIQIHLKDRAFISNAFGDIVFLTREAAEAALAERRADHERPIRRIDALAAGGTCGALGGHEIPIRAILNIPAVDAVEVVQCCECKHGERQLSPGCTVEYHCHMGVGGTCFTGDHDPDFYCKYGERRAD